MARYEFRDDGSNGPKSLGNPELEAAIFHDLDDEEAWLVYGDWLMTQGDARGELITLESQRRQSTPADQAPFVAKIREIETAHAASWAGPGLARVLASSEIDEVLDLEWKYGFIVGAKAAVTYDWEKPSVEQILEAVVSSPAARFLRRVGIGLTDPEGVENEFAGAVRSICSAGELRALRVLHIGDFDYPDDTEISWTDVGDVSEVYRVAPNLEFLHVQGGGIGLGKLAHPKLRRLKLETGGLPRDAVVSLAQADLPALEDLEVWLGAEEYGGDADASGVESLLANDGWPKLRRLGLKNAAIQNEIARVVVESPILSRLEELDLSMGTMNDEGAAHLLERAEALVHLTRIDLGENFISATMQERLQKTLGERVEIGMQEQPDTYGDEVYHYVSVGE